MTKKFPGAREKPWEAISFDSDSVKVIIRANQKRRATMKEKKMAVQIPDRVRLTTQADL